MMSRGDWGDKERHTAPDRMNDRCCVVYCNGWSALSESWARRVDFFYGPLQVGRETIPTADSLCQSSDWRSILRKEVIQPQVPLRLPCYDLVPITELILGACPLAVDSATLDAPRFRGLTGGVYKAQEHIHRSIADLRLLAIPASCRRIAACNLNWGAVFEICSRLRVGVPLSDPL